MNPISNSSQIEINHLSLAFTSPANQLPQRIIESILINADSRTLQQAKGINKVWNTASLEIAKILKPSSFDLPLKKPERKCWDFRGCSGAGRGIVPSFFPTKTLTKIYKESLFKNNITEETEFDYINTFLGHGKIPSNFPHDELTAIFEMYDTQVSDDSGDICDDEIVSLS